MLTELYLIGNSVSYVSTANVRAPLTRRKMEVEGRTSKVSLIRRDGQNPVGSPVGPEQMIWAISQKGEAALR
jgi:hypothetical protein